MADVQKVPALESGKRPETGTMQFGDDWPGIFLRGDSALAFAMDLRCVLNGEDSDIFRRAGAESLLRLLTGCDASGASFDMLESFKKTRFVHDAAIRAAALAEGRREGLKEAAQLVDSFAMPGNVIGNEDWAYFATLEDTAERLRALAAAEPVDTESSIPDFLCSACAIAHGWVKNPTRQMTINQAPAFACCVCGKSDVAGADRRDFGVTAEMVAAVREG